MAQPMAQPATAASHDARPSLTLTRRLRARPAERAIWNGFYLAYPMLDNSKLFPVSLGLYMWNYQAGTQDPSFYTSVITGSALAIVPVIVLFVSLQRFWRSGLTAGAVK